jgi:hypothetical protein
MNMTKFATILGLPARRAVLAAAIAIAAAATG